MSKRFRVILTLLILVLSIFIIAFCNQVKAAGLIVSDPGTYNYLSGIDKKAQQQIEFSQKLQESTLITKESLTGNKKIGYGINNSKSLFSDYFVLSDNNFGEKAVNVSRNLDLAMSDEQVKRDYQQKNLKSSLILSELIINTAKSRGAEILSLSSASDSSDRTKEAIDIQNRILLEILLEVRNTNLILANLLKNQSSQNYIGNPEDLKKRESEVSDYFSGKNGLSRKLFNKNTSGTFSRMSN